VDLANRRYDAAINEAALALAKAEVEQLKIEIERRTIRAPRQHPANQNEAGRVRTGGVLVTPLMLLGDTKFLHVRVDVDENDAWRVSALAFIRGNPDLNALLQFERFEPYVIPKVSLTGQSTERTDTRVLQVIYSFDPAALPVYVGQQVDVFIEAPPIGRASARTDASRKIR
jgi:HlyD family secretion protein